MKKLLLPLGFVLLWLAWPIGAAQSANRPQLFTFHHENVLGTSLELKFAATSLGEAERAEAAALAEIERVAGLLSGYDAQSEFSRWLKTAQQPTRVSPELFEVLRLFDHWRGQTNGALDAAAETISRVWKAAARQQQLPTADALAAAVATVRQPHWRLDATTQTATHLSQAPLILNSFAKSFIINRASLAAQRGANIQASVINIGGDLLVQGDLTEPVLIADPFADAENCAPTASLLIRQRAVATSGNYRRGFQIGDRWFSHIVDPRTGQPVAHVVSATVVAPSSTDAGALATSFCVLQPAESLRLAAQTPGVECLLITQDGQRFTSPGWPALTTPASFPALPNHAAISTSSPTTSPTASPSAVQAWDSSFELLINFELARIQDQRYRRPFVAVWVEDKDRFPVRTVGLWFDKARWLPDLKGWYRGDRVRALAEGNDISASVSSATRAPGKYTLKWDGKDNQGKPVKPGKYTVFIEAAREHGTYQLLRQEMEFRGVPKQITLPGNVEIASASLEYRKRTAAR